MFFLKSSFQFSLSGHYDSFGYNIQAVSDEKGKFIYFSVAGPGSMHDNAAYNTTTLVDLVENLPVGIFLVCDNAYLPSEHLIPVFGGTERLEPGKDDTNYYISQCRIHVERAFGMLKKRFGILQRPLDVSVANAGPLIMSISRMHNWCLSQTIPAHNQDEFILEDFPDAASDQPVLEHQITGFGGTSAMRLAIHDRVQNAGLRRPEN